MRRATLPLVTSIAANVFLVTTILMANRGGPLVDLPSLATTSGSDAARARASDSVDAADYFESLRNRGLSIDETKPLVLSRLETRLTTGSKPRAAEPYWESDVAAKRLAAQLALLDSQEVLRTQLIAIYGLESARDPLFARVFRPLESLYSFLDSEEQAALQRHQLQRQLDEVASSAAAGVQSPHLSARAPSTRGAPFVERPSLAELGQFLAPGSLNEVLYRYSPLAEQLRSARVQFDEREFREAFQLLQHLDREGTSPAAYLEVRAGLRQLLGAERFTRLWATRDPLYTALKAAAPQVGMDEQTTLAAYQILNNGQERLMQAAALRNNDPTRSRAEIQQAMNEQHAYLLGLLGENGANRVLRVQSELGQRLADESGAGRSQPRVTGRSAQPFSLSRDSSRPPQ